MSPRFPQAQPQAQLQAQPQGPAPYAMRPPSVKSARKAAARKARENRQPLPNNLARVLFPRMVNNL